ncbi:ABC transporter permease, partial [Mesorhizobium sp. M4B.F.Ca.ET.169.01.1.1]
SRLNLSPWARVGVLVLATLAIAVLLVSGSWNSLSILKEYASRADSFWAEASKHVTLALGSLAGAVIVGIPLGVLCHRVEKLRAGVLNVLDIIQT